MTYADTYMTKGEFEEMFDHSLYNELRRKVPLLPSSCNPQQTRAPTPAAPSAFGARGLTSSPLQLNFPFHGPLILQVGAEDAFPTIYEKLHRAARV